MVQAQIGKSELVIVSNRLPVHRARVAGGWSWRTSPGGLVSALTPILRMRPSSWIGWSGASGEPPRPFEHDGIDNYPVGLSREEIRAFYDGFSNRSLWPLYHDGIRPSEFSRHWWEPYVDVNRRFARAAADLVARGGLVWVHDYHLQLVPAMLREMRPDVRIGFFLHIPFPPPELFARLPWRREILHGLLAADVVGLQTAHGADNFARMARRFGGARGEGEWLAFEGREVRVGGFPISIDFGRFETLGASSEVALQAKRFSHRVGSGRRILLGVDRLDYTKGIEHRIEAFAELLRSGRLRSEEVVLVQIAVPSRERVQAYRELRSVVERRVGEINGEFGEVGRSAAHYLHRSLPPQELVALYRAADSLLVTPLRDGMNLVAKEFVASRVDEEGVLVLSEFAGAAEELGDALLVNPHDIDGLANGYMQALQMPAEERRERMRRLRGIVRENDVFRWADRFLEALAG